MTQATTKKESIMQRIIKLLERANHPNTPPAEAEVAAAMAERLMQQHMIDRMDLKPEEKGKVISDEWYLNVGEMGDAQNMNYVSNVQSLMETIITHAGCRLNYRHTYGVKEGGTKDYSVRVFKVVGFPEDIKYAELMWYRVYREFIMNINPHWLPGRDKLGENIYHYQRAGFKWPEIWRLAYRHQSKMRETTPTWQYISDSGRNVEIPDYRVEKTCTVLGQVVRAYCKKNGIEYQRHTQRHEAYKASFAQSFTSTIGSRLRKMRDEAKVAAGGEAAVDSDRFALALRDTKEQVDEEFYRLFPEFDPEVQRRRREAEAAQQLADFLAMTPEEQAYVVAEEAERQARWERASRRARRSYGTVRERSVQADMGAWNRGREAANRVNLRNDGEVKEHNKKALG